MFGSRGKGSKAEREVAGLLQAWWRQLEPDCKFVKTPLSGGWGDPNLRAAFQASGDLMTTAARFPWAVEVKRREHWDFMRLVRGQTSPVWGWWAQTRKAADELKKRPMLWFRRNHGVWLVMMGFHDAPTDPRILAWYDGDLLKLGVSVDLRPVVVRGKYLLGCDPDRFLPVVERKA